MKVALLGGTGFVGSYLIDELIRRGHEPVLLVRPGSEARIRPAGRCRVVTGDIKNKSAIEKTVAGCQAVIYAIGILRQFKSRGITFDELQFQGARRTIDAAEKQGAERFILMSANGVKPDGTRYQRTKYQAEEYLKQTKLKWTIFRPSVIFGNPRGRMEFATQLKNQLIDSRLPAPAFFKGLSFWQGGTSEFSPVHVQDVAKILVKSLTATRAIGETYTLGGPIRRSWKSIIKTIGGACDKNKWTVPTPVSVVKAIAAVLEPFTWFPVTRDQIIMLVEGNTCDSSQVFRSFNVIPIPFNKDNLRYLKELTENRA